MGSMEDDAAAAEECFVEGEDLWGGGGEFEAPGALGGVISGSGGEFGGFGVAGPAAEGEHRVAGDGRLDVAGGAMVDLSVGADGDEIP